MKLKRHSNHYTKITLMLNVNNKKGFRKSLKPFFLNGRDDTIRTCDPFVPSEVRYQAALHPVTLTLCIPSI